VLAVATIAVAALAFSGLVWRDWGAEARWAGRTFAPVLAASVLSAAFPEPREPVTGQDGEEEERHGAGRGR
jgi:hypothetical protein